jgi:acetyl esterase/lipase
VFINGDHDTIAVPKESADYASRVRERGDAAETLLLPGASHFDEVAVTSPSWSLVEPVILKAVGVNALR